MKNKEILEKAEEVQSRIYKKKREKDQIVWVLSELTREQSISDAPVVIKKIRLESVDSFEEFKKEAEEMDSYTELKWANNIIAKKLIPEYFRLREEIEEIKEKSIA